MIRIRLPCFLFNITGDAWSGFVHATEGEGNVQSIMQPCAMQSSALSCALCLMCYCCMAINPRIRPAPEDGNTGEMYPPTSVMCDMLHSRPPVCNPNCLALC